MIPVPEQAIGDSNNPNSILTIPAEFDDCVTLAPELLIEVYLKVNVPTLDIL